MNIDFVISKFKLLDLTEYQARVLYALLKNKSSSISDISKVSEVPNTRVYDVVRQLIGMDYVIQISDKPKLYRIRNIDLVLDTLIDKKENQIKQVRNELSSMKDFFKDENSVASNKIIKVDKEADLIKVLNEELMNAKTSIIGFGNSELNNKSIISTINKAISKNVDVKLIANNNCSEAKACFGPLVKNIDHNLSTYMIDDNKVIMKLSSENDTMHHMGVIDGHDGFKDMIKNYFNSKWVVK